MNLQDLMSKLKSIDENAMPPLAPTHDNVPADTECGIPIAIGGPAGAPKQQDNVTMNVSMNGSGAGGISDLMKILRNIEGSDNKDPHQHDVSQLFGEPEADPAEPIMGGIVAKLAHEEMDGEESPMTHEYEVGETIGDEEESWGNSLNGASGHHTHGVDSVTFSGDDMNSKGKSSPLQRVPGSNTLREPTNVSEELVSRLSQMYNAIKEERTEEKDEKGNVVRWRDETPWRKAQNKDGRGKVTNMSDKARRETEKMSKKETEVAEGHSDDDEEKKIRHLMRKYGWSHQEALEYYHYEQHDPKDYEDMEESAMWRDPKYKGKLFTQKKGDSDDYDSIDYGYGMKERPKKDPGQKRRTDAVGDEWENTDKLKSYNGDTGNTTGGAHWNGTGGSTDMKDWKPSPYKDRGVNTQGPRKGLVSKSGIRDVKNRIKGALGHHHTPNLPEQMNESAEVNAMLALNKRLNG